MLSDLAQRLTQELQRNLPPLSSLVPARELQTALQAALRRMNLVSREEFDAQSAVLFRTRLRLEALEQQLAQLELPNKQDAQNENPKVS